ncbi:MAG: Omp28-related outer membrane protein [Chitinophagales bacterium]|nr:Omp28-related outer membrane protein [Chitinophagales bacterium]
MNFFLPLLIFTCILAFNSVFSQTIDSVLLSQNFQGAGMPVGWRQTTLANDGGWKFGATGQVQSTYFVPPAHTKFACTNDDACDCNKSSDRLITDTFDFTGQSAVVLQFAYYYLGISEAASVEVSLDSGVTWQVVEYLDPTNYIWLTHRTDVTHLVAGRADVLLAFKYNDLGTYGYGLAIDDIVAFRPDGLDVALSSITPATNSYGSFGATGTNITLAGVVSNFSRNSISNFVIKWSDGANTWSHSYTDTIAIAATGAFTHSHPYTVPSTGPHTISMWIDFTNDTIRSNDTLITVITGALFTPVHKLVIEDQTQCSTPNGYYSVRGIVWKDSFARSAFATNTEIISVHGEADPMTNAVYYQGVQTNAQLSLAWPQVQIDRKVAASSTAIFNEYNSHINDFGIADVSIDRQYDKATRVLNVSASAHFAINASPGTAQYRLAYVLTEDSVHSTDSAYAQNNGAYANGALGPMEGAGINFAQQPEMVPANLMYYMHVARHIAGAYWGTANSLPATVAEGSTHQFSFPAYNIPTTYNADKMRVIVLLINATDSTIVNSTGMTLIDQPTGIDQVEDAVAAVQVFPNPFSCTTNLVFNLTKPQSVSVHVATMLGNTVSEINNQILGAGEQRLVINGDGLAAGFYLVSLRIGDKMITKRIVMQQ